MKRILFSILVIISFSSCMKDKDAPVIDYFLINDIGIENNLQFSPYSVLHIKVSVTDQGGLLSHSLRYNINSEGGDEIIRIEDEIVNTIVEEFYLDLEELNKNNIDYVVLSGDQIELYIDAEDISGNKVQKSFLIDIH